MTTQHLSAPPLPRSGLTDLTDGMPSIFRQPRTRVVAVEVLVFGLSIADLVAAADWDNALAVTASVLAVFALTLRRRYPVVAQLVGLPNVAFGFALVAQLITTFSLARRTANRKVLAATLLVVAMAQALGMFFGPQANSVGDYTVQRILFAVLIVGAPASTGLLLSAYQRLAEQIAELEVRRQRENELLARTVLVHERSRLAREMHDVVSHQMSLIAVQTGALRMTATDPSVRATADTIRQLAVRTLQELRQTVAALRDSADSEVMPQPRLHDIARLVAESQTGATLSRHDDPEEQWTDLTERTAYRAVQEGLTNAQKHAAGAPISVELESVGGALQIMVWNGPATQPSAADTPLPGGRHGLVGLRERAELLGGTLVYGPTPDGGFALTMRLPKSARLREQAPLFSSHIDGISVVSSRAPGSA